MSFLRLANEIHFYLRIFNDSQKTRSLVLNLISKAGQLPAAERFLTASWSLLQNWLRRKKFASTRSNTVAFGRSWMFSLCLPRTELPALRCCVLCAATQPESYCQVRNWHACWGLNSTVTFAHTKQRWRSLDTVFEIAACKIQVCYCLRSLWKLHRRVTVIDWVFRKLVNKNSHMAQETSSMTQDPETVQVFLLQHRVTPFC